MSWHIKNEDNVTFVTMNTNKENKQNELFFNDLHKTLDIIEEEYPASPMILTGQASIFSVGLDFESVFAFFAQASEEEACDWFLKFRATNLRLFSLPIPTIAAINGHAIGGGTITAIMCDYRIAVEGDYKMGLNETQLGMSIPFSYTELFKHILGNTKATLSNLFGQLYNTEQAKDIGFVHETTSHDQLIEKAIDKAKSIPKSAMRAYGGTKKALQYPVLDRIKKWSEELDPLAIKNIISPQSLKIQAQIYKNIKGVEPPWKIK